MDVDLVKLRTLIAVRATGSITGAAAQLGYTPGAVSQQMAALQRAVHADLLEKVGRQVRLTDKGNLFAEYAQRLVSLAAEAEGALDTAAGRSPRATVMVGVFGTAASALLPRAVVGVRDRFPAIELRSVEVDVDRATAAVASGRVDVAFGVDYPQTPIPRAQEVTMVVLTTERFAIAVPSGDERASSPVSLRSLAEERWILPPDDTFYGRALRTMCRSAGFEPIVEHVVTDTASTLALVATGLGIAPVTELMLALRGEGLAPVPLREKVQRTMVLAYRTFPRPQPAVSAVVDAIRMAIRPRPAARSHGSG